MAMNFPKDGLVDGVTTYRWNDIEYIWKEGRWQSNKVVGANSATNLRDQLADPDSNLLIGGVSVKDLVGRSLSAPLFTVEWFPSREAIQGGYIAADGSVLSRGAYKEAWEGIAARKVPVIPDTDWEAYPEKQGCYTEGDGSSTFRIPDLNGKNLTSYGPAYLGGEGPNITASGRILQDRLQNITGSAGMSSVAGLAVDGSGLTGAFKLGAASNRPSPQALAGYNIDFDASRVARTGDTTRPITAEGVWCIKLYHKVINEGSVDVEQVVADIAAMDTRVTALEGNGVTSSGTTGTVTIEKLGSKKLVSFAVTLAAGSANQTFTIPVAFTSTPICIGTSNTAAANVYGSTPVVSLTQTQITLQNPSSSSASSTCRVTLIGG